MSSVEIIQAFKLLKLIETEASLISKRALKELMSIKNDNCNILFDAIENIIEIYGGDELDVEATVKKIASDRIMNLSKDSTIVSKELGSFREYLKTLDGVSDCDFLVGVWKGDEFGSSKVEGLELLLKDMNRDSESLNEKFIVEKSVEEYISSK